MRASTNGLNRKPWLAATALLVLVGTALLTTPAVPFAATDAAVKTGPDAGQPAAEDLAVQAVFRVMGQTDHPSTSLLRPEHRTVSTT